MSEHIHILRNVGAGDLKDIPQHALYHQEGDVYAHTQLVMKKIQEHEGWSGLTEHEKLRLLYMCAAHDLGKARTTRLEDDGHYHAPHHARVGAIMWREAAWRLNLNPRIREEIAGAVRLHMRPYHTHDVYDLVRWSLSTSVRDLLMLVWADSRGRRPVKEFDETKLWIEAEDLNCLMDPYAFSGGYAAMHHGQSRERSHYSRPVLNARAEMIIMHGLPGSGKDTWIRENAEGWDVVSLDYLRSQYPEKEVAARGRALVRDYLGQGKRVIWNATTLTRRQRQPLVQLATQYGAKLTVVACEAGPDILLARNTSRTDHAMPADVIRKMLRAWEWPEPDEYHQLIHIKAGKYQDLNDIAKAPTKGIKSGSHVRSYGP